MFVLVYIKEIIKNQRAVRVETERRCSVQWFLNFFCKHAHIHTTRTVFHPRHTQHRLPRRTHGGKVKWHAAKNKGTETDFFVCLFFCEMIIIYRSSWRVRIWVNSLLRRPIWQAPTRKQIRTQVGAYLCWNIDFRLDTYSNMEDTRKVHDYKRDGLNTNRQHQALHKHISNTK